MDWKEIGSVIGKAAPCTAAAVAGLIAAAAVAASVCMISAVRIECPENSTAVVLGCRVYGERPSLMLVRRLEAAKEYLDENPDADCILSGGMGEGESISEAECMKQYLTSKGISADRIFMEDKSTTTKENLIFSRNIIEANGLSQTVTLVTDGYHQKRAEMLAENLDIHPYNISGYTSWYIIPTYWVREWFGLLYYGIFG